MQAKSIRGNNLEEIQIELKQCIDAQFRPTLAIAFVSTIQDRPAISKVLGDLGIAVFGATTNGEFIDEDLSKESIAILLMDISKEYFTIVLDEYAGKNYRAVARGIAEIAAQKFKTPAFLITGSGLETDSEELLQGLVEILGSGVNVYGGMAGDDYQFMEQHVFTEGKETNHGIVALILDEDKIIIKGRATCGWKPIGTERTVTRSEANHVYTIDDIPVLELTMKYGGLQDISKVRKETAVTIAIHLPLQLQREKGDPVMRPGLVVNWDDGSFICSGCVPQGSKVRFSLPPDFDVIEKVVQGAQDLKATQLPEADALVVFSCAGRLMALGPLMGSEIEGLREIWDVPMVGMFSNAELGRATDGNLEMHNLATCYVALKER